VIVIEFLRQKKSGCPMNLEVADISTWFSHENAWGEYPETYSRGINFTAFPAFRKKIEFSDGNILQHPHRAIFDGERDKNVLCTVHIQNISAVLSDKNYGEYGKHYMRYKDGALIIEHHVSEQEFEDLLRSILSGGVPKSIFIFEGYGFDQKYRSFKGYGGDHILWDSENYPFVKFQRLNVQFENREVYLDYFDPSAPDPDEKITSDKKIDEVSQKLNEISERMKRWQGYALIAVVVYFVSKFFGTK
jgi:hypothetical protein